MEAMPNIPAAVTNAVSWRKEGIRYRKNEVFLDVIESVNLLVSSRGLFKWSYPSFTLHGQVSKNGQVLQSEIVGSVKMKVRLTGMPELRLGLNDKVLFENTGSKMNGSIASGTIDHSPFHPGTRSKAVELEDVKFHQCVRLSRFENDRTISFIPPDGEFELMSYRLNTQVKPLIWIESHIERHSHSRVEYLIKVGQSHAEGSSAWDTSCDMAGKGPVQATVYS